MSEEQILRRTLYGQIVQADSLLYMRDWVSDDSLDLIITSPPFALLRKKDYGNETQEAYVAWFKEFGKEFLRILKPTGSLVIDIGGSWIPGQPTRSLYHFDLLLMLCREVGFHLAQELYWWNPSKLPTPAEWVTVRRVRVKDAVNSIYWLSKTPWPKASNRRVLAPYSSAMKDLLRNGYRAKRRPSGHDISNKFQRDNEGAIPPNLIALPNTESNSYYLRYCEENGYQPHPARFPARLPEYFVRMLTDVEDKVFDPFAGSCVTGEVCERLQRHWTCCEIEEEYLLGALGRFTPQGMQAATTVAERAIPYQINSPAGRWNGIEAIENLPADGGRRRPTGTLRSPDQVMPKKESDVDEI